MSIEFAGEMFAIPQASNAMARAWALANIDWDQIVVKPVEVKPLKQAKAPKVDKPKKFSRAFDLDRYQLPKFKEFGDWTVTGPSLLKVRDCGRKLAMVPVVCTCGYKSKIEYHRLAGGHSKNCQQCGRKKNKAQAIEAGETVARSSWGLYCQATYKIDLLLKKLMAGGINLRIVADGTGFSQSTVSDWKAGTFRPKSRDKSDTLIEFAAKHLSESDLVECEIYP